MFVCLLNLQSCHLHSMAYSLQVMRSFPHLYIALRHKQMNKAYPMYRVEFTDHSLQNPSLLIFPPLSLCLFAQVFSHCIK